MVSLQKPMSMQPIETIKEKFSKAMIMCCDQKNNKDRSNWKYRIDGQECREGYPSRPKGLGDETGLRDMAGAKFVIGKP